MNIANQASIYSKGLKELGIDSTSVEYIDWFTKFPCDLRITQLPDILSFADKAVEEYDIFHFHWAWTLHPGRNDLPILKDKGKKVFMNFWGSDCRQWTIAKAMNPFIRVKVPDERHIKASLTNLAQFISVALVADFELERYVSPFFDKVIQVPQAIVTDDYPVSPADNQKPLFVHAPTDSYVKGSYELAEAVKRLKKEGFDFDVRFITGMAHEAVKKHYAQADVVIDSITEGVYGLLAIECMSMGKPVVGWITDEAKEYYRTMYGMDPPMITANPETIYDRLKDILNGEVDIERLRQEAPRYVRDNHDYLKVAERLKEVYDN